MKPFLILQLRPETEASDSEFNAFLNKGGLTPDRVHRIRLDQEGIPDEIDLNAYSGVIVGGGPGCVSDPAEKKPETEARIEQTILGAMPAIIDDDIPFLGCCYGIGVLAHHLGSTWIRSPLTRKISIAGKAIMLIRPVSNGAVKSTSNDLRKLKYAIDLSSIFRKCKRFAHTDQQAVIWLDI